MESDENGPRREGVELRSAQIAGVDFAERVIEIIAVPYGQETVVEYRGEVLRELVEPGGFDALNPSPEPNDSAFDGIEKTEWHVTANREHNYERTFGKVIGYRSGDPRGLISLLKVSETPLGDETLQLAADGLEFVRADLRDWTPDYPVDVLVSNAKFPSASDYQEVPAGR